MNCNCNCPNFYFVTAATITGGQLVLTFNNTPTVTDKQRFCFRFSRGITLPSGYDLLDVVANVSVDATATTIALWDKYGDALTGDELITVTDNGNVYANCRYVYKGFIGAQTEDTDTIYHLITSNIPKIEFHCNCE